jgi:hypothetical protein
MTIIGWCFALVMAALIALLIFQRLQHRWTMRHIHRNISYSACVIEMEARSIVCNKAVLGVAAKLLRDSAKTAREFMSEKDVDWKFAASPMDSEFGRTAIVGTVMAIDCRIVEPCDWEKGIVRAVIEYPAKLHGRDACIKHLTLDRFIANPVILDSGGICEPLPPIGCADAKPSESVGVSLELKLAIGRTSRAVHVRDELKSGRLSICAYVKVNSATTLSGYNGRNDTLCDGELVALQPFADGLETVRAPGEPE